jgi:hypothetical protein
MKKILTALVAAAALATSLTPADARDHWRPGGPRYYHGGGYHGGGYYPHGGYYHHNGNYGGAVAAGVVGGLILGGLAAQAAQPSYVYEDDPVVVRRRPARVYADDDVVVVRRRAWVPACRTFIKYDIYGRPYEYMHCN